MNAIQEKLAQVVTVKAGAKAVAGAATLSEGAQALRDLIVELLQPVPTPGNEGTFCGLLAYNAQQRLMFAKPDARGQTDVYDSQAMIHGALRSDDAEPGQVAILEVAAECIDKLGDLLELIGSGDDGPTAAVTDADISAAEGDAPPALKPEKDYLGHPNRLTEAFERFNYAVEDARKDAATDPRRTARQVGIDLLRMEERLRCGAACFEAMIAALPNDADTDSLGALLTMADEYQRATEVVFCKFAGEVLMALEQGGLA